MPRPAPVSGLLSAVLILLAVVLQTTLIARLPLPGGRPDLILLSVVALALAAGPGAGLVAGFAGGLMTDLLAAHPVGLAALVLCLVGYLCGLLQEDAEGSVLLPLGLVAAAALASTLGEGALLALVGKYSVSGSLDWRAVLTDLPTSVLYDVLLAPFVVAGVTAVRRRVQPAGERPR